jgi:GNAT superfamily N-acetyltransferase
MTRRIVTDVDPNNLERLVGQYQYGRYCEDPHLALASARRLVFDNLRKSLSGEGVHTFCAVSDAGELLGIILFKLSQWDTEHFGFPFGIVDSLLTLPGSYDQEFETATTLLRAFQKWCQSNAVRFVSTRAPALHLPVVHSLESQGFRYIETWIYNKYDLTKEANFGDSRELRLAEPSDRQFMLEFSKGAFVTHRFHADARFSRDKAESLYEKWILTAFHDPLQEILVLDAGGKPAAFMIYYKSDLRDYFGLQFAMWKMALMDPQARGQGLGSQFFLALLNRHRQDGLDVVDSGLSMRNLVSLNLHNKLNFRVTSSVLTYHLWIG